MKKITRIGIGGPVGSGKTAIVEAITPLLLDAGIRVPEDVAIVGLDDIELAARARVPLTTVQQPVNDIGARAVDYVLARMRGERPVRRQLLPPSLVVRASSTSSSPVAT